MRKIAKEKAPVRRKVRLDKYFLREKLLNAKETASAFFFN